MKKISVLFLVLSLGLFSFTSFSTSQGSIDYTKAEIVLTARKYIMKLNGQPIKLDISPVWDAQNKTLLIPLRAFADLMNYQIDWNQASGTATFTRDNSSFQLQIQGQKIVLTSSFQISHYQTQLKSKRILLDSQSIEKLLAIQSSFDLANLEITFYTNRNQIHFVAPNFQLKDIPGNTFDLEKTLKSNQYKIVILNFYATRCPICGKALPLLEKFYEDYKDKGVLVVGVNTDTQNMEKDRDAVIAKYKLTYPIVLDKNADVYTLYAVSGIPNLFIINQNSEIIQHELGVDADYFTFLRSFIDETLKQQ
jgi:peroxiredoxin